MSTYDDTLVERFWALVDRSEDPATCWNWVGPVHSNGYGIFNLGSRQQLAHRVVPDLLGQRVQYGSVVMHTCGNRLCCNPAHLRVVSRSEHMTARSRLQRLPRPTKPEDE